MSRDRSKPAVNRRADVCFERDDRHSSGAGLGSLRRERGREPALDFHYERLWIYRAQRRAWTIESAVNKRSDNNVCRLGR